MTRHRLPPAATAVLSSWLKSASNLTTSACNDLPIWPTYLTYLLVRFPHPLASGSSWGTWLPTYLLDLPGPPGIHGLPGDKEVLHFLQCFQLIDFIWSLSQYHYLTNMTITLAKGLGHHGHSPHGGHHPSCSVWRTLVAASSPPASTSLSTSSRDTTCLQSNHDILNVMYIFQDDNVIDLTVVASAAVQIRVFNQGCKWNQWPICQVSSWREAGGFFQLLSFDIRMCRCTRARLSTGIYTTNNNNQHASEILWSWMGGEGSKSDKCPNLIFPLQRP